MCAQNIEEGWVFENYLFNSAIENSLPGVATMHILNMIWWIHPITESCMLSSFDYWDILWELVQIYKYPKWLGVNVIENFDEVYNSVLEGVDFFKYDNVADQEYAAFNSGWAFGYTVYLIL